MNDAQLIDHSLDKSLDIFTLLSHEIRTPLNAIIGISDLLQRPDTTNKEEYYKVLQSTSENLLELVNNILDFSKIHSGDLLVVDKAFNLRKKLQHCLYSQQQSAKEKKIEFNLEFDPKIPDTLIGDQVKFCQIFVNLVSNSIKFTENGAVDINVGLENEDEKSLTLVCQVQDTGIGIPSAQINRIFEPFHQGEQDINIKYAGTGLGLSITQSLIKMLDGELGIESEVGVGTRFRFTLPFKKKYSTLETPKSKDPDVFRLNGKKVLVVEDNKINILVITKYLELWKMDWEVAENGKEALEKIINSDYDIVLMDLYMPVMNGLETIKKIRSLPDDKYHHLPVIALTAIRELTGAQEVYTTYFTDYLMKPFESGKLHQLLKTHCT